MKRVVLLMLIGCFAAHAAITVVQGNPVRTGAFSGTTTPALAYAGAVTSGNTLIGLYSGESSQTITSVADSVNGAWTVAVSQGTNLRTAIYYKTSTAAGTPTVTFTVNNCTNGCQITLLEVSGASSPSIDKTNNSNGTTGVSNPGNLNTAFANSILVAGTENLNGESTLGASYTFLQSANGFAFAGTQYRIVSSTSNYSTAFATDTGGNWGAVAANFGESGSSAATCQRHLTLMGVGC